MQISPKAPSRANQPDRSYIGPPNQSIQFRRIAALEVSAASVPMHTRLGFMGHTEDTTKLAYEIPPVESSGAASLTVFDGAIP